ncbi:MAG: hypothetical protein WEF50_01045 [Myxococcota bacterium]
MVTAADAELATLVVRYTPLRGSPAEIEDRIYIGRPGEVAAVYGVGRWLRILRAGRVHVSGDPYELCRDTDRALGLLRRCIGSTVELLLGRRLERSLTLWTDTGVERIGAVMDFVEGTDGLVIRRRGGGALMYVERDSLIRYESALSERLEVISVELAPRCK